MTGEEIKKLESYLRGKFGAPSIGLRTRGKLDDSVEVYLGEEFLGVITKDDEDGDLAYQFNMAILEFDLEDAE
ncbi:MAG: DUF3126 family protein [Pseudomonadota bacterium]